MALFFYRKPEYIDKETGPITYSSCYSYAEKAASYKSRIPDRLSFDKVLEGDTLPPCSLADFMDYLVYVSHDAENLQFLLWLRDYTKRFNELRESEKALSPKWIPDGKATAELLQSKSTSPALATREKPPLEKAPLSIFVPRPSTANSMSTKTTTDSPIDPQSQPLRAEVNLIIQHYLRPSAPRELNLSFRVRSSILDALTQTTHPSAFSPLRDLTEQCLCNQSHPNFIRWAISNGRAPRSVILRHMLAFNLLCFVLGEISLVLSHYSRWARLSLSPLLFLAIMMLHAAVHGFCFLLVLARQRELRPWEIWSGVEPKRFAGSSVDSIPEPTRSPSWMRNSSGGGGGGGFDWGHLPFKSPPPQKCTFTFGNGNTDGYGDVESQFSGESSSGATAASRASRMKPFGLGNRVDGEAWVERWRRMKWWRKGVLTVSMGKVPCYEEGIREIHMRVLWQSLFWAVVVTVLVMAVIIALPVGGVY